jgi:ribonuclease J
MNKIEIFALGGLNENGKNMYVVKVNEDIFIFDAGLKYPDDRLFGIDYILPNYDFVGKNLKNIKGIFLSHGHDEHMGAAFDILSDYPEVPIYATKFTLEVLKTELETKKYNLNEIKPHVKIDFEENSIFPIALSHSVPESVGFVLNTKDGAIVYTSNFVIDSTMIGSYKTDIGKLAYIGKQGVLCLLSESLYADKRGFTSPNHRITSLFSEAINKNPGRILVNIQQAELYRMQELFNALKYDDRKIVIMGKRLESLILYAIDNKHINLDKNKIGSIHDISKNAIVIISDEREKPFSNMIRISKGQDRFIKISSDDTVVFASPVYDGLEKTAADLLDDLAKINVNLIIVSNKKHLEYHASSEDLLLMINLMNPKYYFPVIGEYRHQVANANLAYQIGMKEEDVLLKQNGDIAIFINGKLQENKGFYKTDQILIDGKTSEDIGSAVLYDRAALSENGIVLVNVTIKKSDKTILAGPEVLTRGFVFVKESKELIDKIIEISREVLVENTKDKTIDFTKVRNLVREKLSKFLFQETERNPIILITIQEV